MSDLSYIYTAEKKPLLITKYFNIFVGSIPLHLLFSKSVFSLCRANIECWLLL